MLDNNLKLGVNIDHVATLRQVRGTHYPDILAAAKLAEKGGADSITVHLREDRRHIQDEDVINLNTKIETRLNLELAANEEMKEFALNVRPSSCCIVPERREELTTEGGLDVLSNHGYLETFCRDLLESGVQVSLFLEPNIEYLRVAKEMGVSAIELHTGAYTLADTLKKETILKTISETALFGRDIGLTVNAGHGLDYDNVTPIGEIQALNELNIGHAIICKAIDVGLESAVKEMKKRMLEARG